MKLDVLYEDNHLIAVRKPAGLLVQEDISGDLCLMDVVKEYLKDKYNKPGNVFLGMIHRLDRPVEGVVLFARTSKGASRLSEQFRDRTVEKIYHAIVEGIPPKDDETLINYIEKVGETTFKAKITDKPGANTAKAELSYHVVEKGKDTSLLKIALKTGKFHQIRAQLSYSGFPIRGDVKYGSKEALEDGKIELYATSLSFTLPTKDERITVSIEAPRVSK